MKKTLYFLIVIYIFAMSLLQIATNIRIIRLVDRLQELFGKG